MICPSTGLNEEDLVHIGQVASSVPVENFTIHGGMTFPYLFSRSWFLTLQLGLAYQSIDCPFDHSQILYGNKFHCVRGSVLFEECMMVSVSKDRHKNLLSPISPPPPSLGSHFYLRQAGNKNCFPLQV